MKILSSLLLGVAGVLPAFALDYRNPVRAGDYPDPSVIRVGDDYWAAATSSEWAPYFPVLHSRDLVNWDVAGYAFENAPTWAKSNFWAPEIAEHKGKFFLYYTARDRETNRLAIAVASADKPAGPYTDHGQLDSQPAGSIDPVPFTDAAGTRWLIWKVDGNSRKEPTPLLIQRLSDDGLKLVGERREILRNDTKWEGAVVEGPFVLRRGDYYYLFYSGGACCGRRCDYALGVARAKDPLGPWEKAPTNPILATNAEWRCPGHGSIVTDPQGRNWLLYHAYAQKGFVATGREMLLDEVTFGADGWPAINGGKGPSTLAAAPASACEQRDVTRYREDFNTTKPLDTGWQWVNGRKPAARIAEGELMLTSANQAASVVRSITTPSFLAETTVDLKRLTAGASAGLVVYGDWSNEMRLMTNGKQVQVWTHREQLRKTIATVDQPAGEMLALRIACVDGNRFRFAIREANGAWREIGGETDGSYLPPWDRGVRVGVCVAGGKDSQGGFDYFVMTPDEPKFLTP